MSSLLVIEVSPGGEHSVSRAITGEYVTAWKAAHADGQVIVKDLATNPVPHLDAEAIFAGYTPEESRSSGMVGITRPVTSSWFSTHSAQLMLKSFLPSSHSLE